jgi:hypothetical protein
LTPSFKISKRKCFIINLIEEYEVYKFKVLKIAFIDMKCYKAVVAKINIMIKKK